MSRHNWIRRLFSPRPAAARTSTRHRLTVETFEDRVVPTVSCGPFTTFTQGGWGAAPNGNNPGDYLHATFSAAYPTGLQIGDQTSGAAASNNTVGNWAAKFSSASVITTWLPHTGPSGALGGDTIDPVGEPDNDDGTLAGQTLALALNLGFDDYDAAFSPSTTDMGGLIVQTGPFAGKTADFVLATCNAILAGKTDTGYSAAEANDAATAINENFDNGTTDKGFLDCDDTTSQEIVTVDGVKFEDINCDGDRDAGEGGLSGWVITITVGSATTTVTTGAGGSYSASFTVSSADLAAGLVYSVSEEAQAGWHQTTSPTALTGTLDTVNSSATGVNIGNHAEATLDVTKTADPTSVQEGGVGNQDVTYTYQVTQTSAGNTVLSDILLTDTDGEPDYQSGDANNDGLLQNTETWVYTLTTTLPVQDAGTSHTNTATVTGTDCDDTLTDDATATVNYINVDPVITVVKSGPATANVGSTVVYTYSVTNDSPASTDAELSDVSLSDTDGTPSPVDLNFDGYNDGDSDSDNKLDFGETWTFTLSAVMPASGRTHTNTVTATGTDNEETVDTGTDEHTLDLTFTLSGVKVQDHDGAGFGDDDTVPTAQFTINVYADTNDDGDYDAGIDQLAGSALTSLVDGTYSISNLMHDETYFVFEGQLASWVQTAGGNLDNNYYTHVVGESVNIAGDNFANVHLGKNQGLTIGYYSNKNGQKTITADDLSYLRSLNLRNANGSAFDPTTAAQVSTFLTSANAQNMANMLSAQLIATVLNVRHGLVTSSAVYVGPGNQMGSFNTQGANLVTNLDSHGPLTTGVGFVDINTLIARADTELGLFDVSTTSINSGERPYMEAMKNVFDAINNNVNFFVL